MAAPMRASCLQAIQKFTCIRVQKIKPPCVHRCTFQAILCNSRTKRYDSNASRDTSPILAPGYPYFIQRRNVQRQLNRVPVDDVWFSSCYAKEQVTFLEAIQMHRELGAPEMLNHMDASLFLHIKLNMTTKKKTKFISDFNHTMILPHKMEKITPVNVLVFCKTEEEETYAESRGAKYAGATQLISMLNKGEIRAEDYDYALCTAEMYSDIIPLKKILKHTFPNNKLGTIGLDVESLLDLFLDGCSFSSKKKSDAASETEIPIAKLNWPDEQIIENMSSVIDVVSQKRGTQHKNLGPFITSVLLKCPKSGEKFLIKDEEVAACISTVKYTPQETDKETELSTN